MQLPKAKLYGEKKSINFAEGDQTKSLASLKCCSQIAGDGGFPTWRNELHHHFIKTF